MSTDEPADAVDDMLSWRFQAGMAAFFVLIAGLAYFGGEELDRPPVILVLGPLAFTTYCSWRYVRARRELVAEGLWPSD